MHIIDKATCTMIRLLPPTSADGYTYTHIVVVGVLKSKVVLLNKVKVIKHLLVKLVSLCLFL